MPIEGSLDLFQLPEILQMVSLQGKTGILTIQGEDDIVAVSFKDGQVVAADALNQTVEESLGQVLAAQGLVPPSAFGEVAAKVDSSGERLLDLLVAEGLVTRQQLLEALRVQTYQLLRNLIHWRDGEFKFYSGDEVAFEEGFRPLPVGELLIRAAEDLGEREIVESLPGAHAVFERTGKGRTVKVLDRETGNPGSDPDSLWLRADEAAILDEVDGRSPVADILAGSGFDDYEGRFLLHRLEQAGILRRRAAEAAPQAGQADEEMPEPELLSLEPPPLPAAPTDARWEPPPPLEDEGPALEEEVPELAEAPPPPRVRKRRPPRTFPPATAAVRYGLLAATALVVVLLASRPSEVLLSLPWEGRVEDRLEAARRMARYQQLDRAARTYFLLEGHYPDDLTELSALHLVDEGAIRDPEGHTLAYSASDVAYEIAPVIGGSPEQTLGTRETIAGDFLLDPEFLRGPDEQERAPLVLLD